MRVNEGALMRPEKNVNRYILDKYPLSLKELEHFTNLKIFFFYQLRIV